MGGCGYEGCCKVRDLLYGYMRGLGLLGPITRIMELDG